MKRIFHTWDKWECYPAGFYENKHPEGLKGDAAEIEYAAFLRDSDTFKAALGRVVSEWKNSCEHYLSNDSMNRIAWLGQAACCIHTGTPACFRGGFNLLLPEEKRIADQHALDALNRWLESMGEPQLSMADAQSRTEANLY